MADVPTVIRAPLFLPADVKNPFLDSLMSRRLQGSRLPSNGHTKSEKSRRIGGQARFLLRLMLIFENLLPEFLAGALLMETELRRAEYQFDTAAQIVWSDYLE